MGAAFKAEPGQRDHVLTTVTHAADRESEHDGDEYGRFRMCLRMVVMGFTLRAKAARRATDRISARRDHCWKNCD